MLEVKGLKKIYKPKKGAVVNALAGVDLAFPEKGMIFILGKSGSGKSTLLNLLGGLDTYDAGEIIIKGKSSKDFTQSEFDSYRNTYLGFIFQSYNILDEFSVGDNISLAIELQHQKCTKERIDEILKEVDLEGFAHRKPRELSGGQKQRVAIARALVKNPEIILADEPTGALDSTTGIAVFDTLKKLSKEKLVIIVSHDREFAENYGDRVIEFKDGLVISDIVKYDVENVKVNSNVSLYENQAIQIKEGYQLTLKDFEEINKHIAKCNSDVFITLNKRTSTATKTAARINDTGASEAFRDTKKEDILIGKDNKFKSITSRLGFKNSFKIGASGLKVKPVRLMITILLSFSAFTLFGIADTMACYDKVTATTASLYDSSLDVTAYEKKKVIVNENHTHETTYKFDLNDIDLLEEKTNLSFLPVVEVQYNNEYYSNFNLFSSAKGDYYTTRFQTLTTITEDIYKDFGYNLTGRLPNNKNEIVVTNHTLEVFMECGLSINNTEVKINNANDLIGQNITFYCSNKSDNYYSTVVGVLDTNLNSEKYEDLKGDGDNSWTLSNSFAKELKTGLHGNVFVHEDLMPSTTIESVSFDGNIQQVVNGNEFNMYFNKAKNDIDLKSFSDNGKTELNDNEMLIASSSFYNLFSNEINQYNQNVNSNGGREIIQSYVDKLTDEEVENAIGTTSRSDLVDDLCFMLDRTYPGIKPGFQILMDAGVFNNLTADVTINYYDSVTYDFIQKDMKIVGSFSSDNNYETVIISENFYDEILKKSDNGLYDLLVSILPKDKTELAKLVEFSYEVNDSIKYKLSNPVQTSIDQANDFVEMTTVVFLGLGAFFAAFASLLLYNFISVSISYKQKEIGILRAIGARSKDVFGIFFSETLIIGLINFVLATIAIFVSSVFINSFLNVDLGLGISLLSPSIRQIVLVFGVTLLVSFISSFFPVYKIAIKRPIDSIRQG